MNISSIEPLADVLNKKYVKLCILFTVRINIASLQMYHITLAPAYVRNTGSSEEGALPLSTNPTSDFRKLYNHYINK